MQILFPLLVCKVEQPHPVDNGDSMIEVSSYISEVISDCGCEMAGITVSKAISKWFNGKEMALAERFGNIEAPILFCVILLLIGLINFIRCVSSCCKILVF